MTLNDIRRFVINETDACLNHRTLQETIIANLLIVEAQALLHKSSFFGTITKDFDSSFSIPSPIFLRKNIYLFSVNTTLLAIGTWGDSERFCAIIVRLRAIIAQHSNHHCYLWTRRKSCQFSSAGLSIPRASASRVSNILSTRFLSISTTSKRNPAA